MLYPTDPESQARWIVETERFNGLGFAAERCGARNGKAFASIGWPPSVLFFARWMKRGRPENNPMYSQNAEATPRKRGVRLSYVPRS
jgi:hypothetical protein